MSKEKVIDLIGNEEINSLLRSIGIKIGSEIEIMDNVINIIDTAPNGIVVTTKYGVRFIPQDVANCIITETIR